MNLPSDINYSNFLDHFERLTPTNYLEIEPKTVEGRCFSIVYAKENKNLNTKAVLNIVEQAFSHFRHNRAFESQENFEQCQEKVNRLAQALQVYGTRLRQSAPWYWKILAFFGFQRSTDKRIAQLVSTISQQGASQENLTEAIQRTTREALTTPPGYLRYFYHFVLGNADLKISQLDGAGVASSQYHYLSLLKEFRSTLAPASPAHPLLQEITDQLSLGAQVAIAQENNLAITTFMERLQVFLSDPTRTFFMFPGGYSKKDQAHCVVFEITREGNESFSLALVDTGVIAGNLHLLNNDSLLNNYLDLSTTGLRRKIINEQALIDQKINQWHAFIELQKNNRTQDLHYTGLNAAQFSESFFQALFAFKYSSNTDHSMDKVVEFLDQQLATPNKSNLIAAGRSHTRQKKGVCAQKSFATWLHTRLGNELYQRFKVFYTAKEIERLEQLFAEQPAATEEALAGYAFVKLEKSAPEPAATIEPPKSKSKPKAAEISADERPLSEEEWANFPSALNKLKTLIEVIDSCNSLENFLEKSTFHWTPQQAKHEIRQLGQQILQKREQKLQTLLTPTPA
ncbi:hypothetical protein PNK_0437 [Candidatus Protochlamydia naegleriophila]|uniref:Uncharacterized protein n=1 Tax=Candidatus Protochlamydia naegleriophila TaxID=389348 RepID=A0A0U5JBA1_9BACT|nr:hypothetical protein [Candidatus Protochlamydia naegleriophila]CUI16068.1 hypothetical protein PNK_0437 [Candidatus Protochlamydia naegleriophila]